MHVFVEAHLKPREDVANNLREDKIKNSHEQIEELKKKYKWTLESIFTKFRRNLLYNICNGQSASQESETYLLNVNKLGDEQQRKQFLDECSVDPKRFEQSIKRNVIHTFKAKEKTKRKDGKI